MYLFKYLSNSGACPRRKAADLIKDGRVKINGKIEKDLFYLVQKDDVVEYSNKVWHLPSFVYILLNKPKDYLCTVSDPQGRRTILDLIDSSKFEKIYPVGRLDRMTTGLVLLTNDGDLTQKLAHPKYEVTKGYRVVLEKALLKQDFQDILKGLILEDGLISVDKLSYVPNQRHTAVEIFIHSGRNRIVRRIFEHLGYRIKKLDRFYYAGLTKKNLLMGKWRLLTRSEVAKLKEISI
ncbi:MAG: pseudouridine synthase [bacterium]